MSIMQIVDGEVVAVAIDFGSLLGSGETLSSVSSVTSDPTGELTLGTASISGDQVVFTVTASGSSVAEGRRYLIEATVVTSSAETLKEHATIAIL